MSKKNEIKSVFLKRCAQVSLVLSFIVGTVACLSGFLNFTAAQFLGLFGLSVLYFWAAIFIYIKDNGVDL